MKPSVFAIALLGLVAPSLHAQLDNTDPPYQAICRAALAKPLPTQATDPALQPDCDATAAYFGIGRPVDYAAARSCAYAEYAHPEKATGSIFYGAGILSMIYANGQGVPADLDLATRFTCENQGAPREIEFRLDLLAKDRETHTLAPFDLCDTTTSGYGESWCETIEARFSDIDRNHKLDAFRASLPASATQPFAELQKAEEEFVQQRTHNEVDLSGTARGANALEEQNDLRDQFLADLLAVTATTFHQDTALKAADKQLTEALKPIRIGAVKAKLPRAPRTVLNTTVTFQGVEETQQAWLPLRDSWMAFARAASSLPNADAQAAALVTLERARQLRELTHPEKPDGN